MKRSDTTADIHRKYEQLRSKGLSKVEAAARAQNGVTKPEEVAEPEVEKVEVAEPQVSAAVEPEPWPLATDPEDYIAMKKGEEVSDAVAERLKLARRIVRARKAAEKD